MIIDFHTHIFPPHICRDRQMCLDRDVWFGQLYSDPQAKIASAEDLIDSMDAGGVDSAVTFGFGWADEGLCREANDYVIDAVSRFPDRLMGFISVNPCKPAEMQQEVERCVARGLVGIGELMPDGQCFSFDEMTVATPLAEVARHYRLPILTHTSEPVGHLYPGKGERPIQTITRFAEQFPDVILICAHWGGGLFLYELMPKLVGVLSNVYYDTAASLYVYRDRIFHIATQVAPDKILFGTDYPLISHRQFLKRVRSAGLPPLVERGVLGENARHVLGLPARRADFDSGAEND